MKVRIVCDRCSGELHVPQTATGKRVRCPFCGHIFAAHDGSDFAFDSRSSSGGGVRTQSAVAAESTPPWAGDEEDLDSPVPWYLLLGALAPAGLLYFVQIEPVGIVVAGVLVALAMLVSFRRSWSRWSRFTGVLLCALLAYGSALAVARFAEGSYAQIQLKNPFGDGGLSLFSRNSLADAAWNDVSLSDANAVVLFPGTPEKGGFGDSDGVDVVVYESRFPDTDTTFALHYFDLPLAAANEKAEADGLARLEPIVYRIFFEGNPETKKRIFFYEHPGYETLFTVWGKSTQILMRAFLVRNRVFVVSVSSAKFDELKGDAEKFLNSFRLMKYQEGLRTPPEPDRDWKLLGRLPIPKPKALGVYRGHHFMPILMVAFSADGKFLYTGSKREHLVRWDWKSGLGQIAYTTEAYDYYGIDPTGKNLVAPQDNGIRPPVTLQYWSLDEPPLSRTNNDYFGFWPDGKQLVTRMSGNLTGWEMKSQKHAWTRFAHHPDVAFVALSDDGKVAATCGIADAVIKLYSATKGGDLATLKGHRPPVRRGLFPIYQLVFSPDGKTLASAGMDASAKLWDLTDLNQPKLHLNLSHDQPVACVEYASSGKWIATGDFEGVVRLWDPKNGKVTAEFRPGPDCAQIQALRFAPDDSVLAVGLQMGFETGFERAGVALFDVATLPAPLEPHVSYDQTEEPPLFDPKRK